MRFLATPRHQRGRSSISVPFSAASARRIQTSWKMSSEAAGSRTRPSMNAVSEWRWPMYCAASSFIKVIRPPVPSAEETLTRIPKDSGVRGREAKENAAALEGWDRKAPETDRSIRFLLNYPLVIRSSLGVPFREVGRTEDIVSRRDRI